MQPRTTGILFMITAALAAFVWFYEIEGEAGRLEAEEARNRLFPGIEQSQISAIALTTSDGRDARLELRGSDWSLVEPLEFPADAFTVDGMTSNLASITSESSFDAGRPLEEYGLDPASARVLRFTADGAEYALRVGGQAPVGGATYVLVGDAPPIHTVEGYKAKSFERSLFDLRDKKIVEFDRESVDRIEARWPEGSVVVERVAPTRDEPDGSSWRLRAPLAAPADAEAIDGLLSDLSYLRATGFDDGPAADAGFGAPSFEVRLAGTGADEATPFEISFQAGAVRGDDLLVRVGEGAVAAVPKARLDDLPRDVFAYRHKALARFSISDAEQLDLYFQPAGADAVQVKASRDASGWSAEPASMDVDRLPRMLSELSRLDASGVVAESLGGAELAALGLAPPRTIVSVFGTPDDEDAEEAEEPEDGPGPDARTKLAEIHLGTIDGVEGIVARARGDATIYRLPVSLAEHLPVNLEAFQNRFTFAEPIDEPPPAEATADDYLSPLEESP